tara:strand:- start:230 stop:733 length:504 start_codon:yes stop_codon:yes gene_type:complete
VLLTQLFRTLVDQAGKINMQMPELDDLYADIILDHYKNPRNQGLIPSATLNAEGFNPFCGDQVKLSISLGTNGTISNVGFEGEGCSISQASASIMTDLLIGKNLEQASLLNNTFRQLMSGNTISELTELDIGELAALEGVKEFPVRIKCALLPWATLVDAMNQYHQT